MKFSAIGTFDTLNPFVIKGVPAAGIGLIFDTLMAASEDEPATDYGLVAESARSRPGPAVGALHSAQGGALPRRHADHAGRRGLDLRHAARQGAARLSRLLRRRDQGRAGGRARRALPLQIGEQPRIAADPRRDAGAVEEPIGRARDFAKTTLDPPLGSGPYKIESVDPGRSITYRRVADYWGADLPVNKGRYNVDTIRYDYYRDATIALEAFKAGQYDIRRENSSKDWATGYDSPALRDGLIKKEVIPNQLPSGMQGFGYNLRRPIFQDPRVRQALAYAFDFEWSNKNLFYGAYHPHPQLFRQFRTRRDRGAAGRGTEDPRTVPRPDPATRSSPRNTTRRNTTAPAISATGCARRSSC